MGCTAGQTWQKGTLGIGEPCCSTYWLLLGVTLHPQQCQSCSGAVFAQLNPEFLVWGTIDLWPEPGVSVLLCFWPGGRAGWGEDFQVALWYPSQDRDGSYCPAVAPPSGMGAGVSLLMVSLAS